jgi:hypothetical protein
MRAVEWKGKWRPVWRPYTPSISHGLCISWMISMTVRERSDENEEIGSVRVAEQAWELVGISPVEDKCNFRGCGLRRISSPFPAKGLSSMEYILGKVFSNFIAWNSPREPEYCPIEFVRPTALHIFSQNSIGRWQGFSSAIGRRKPCLALHALLRFSFYSLCPSTDIPRRSRSSLRGFGQYPLIVALLRKSPPWQTRYRPAIHFENALN